MIASRKLNAAIALAGVALAAVLFVILQDDRESGSQAPATTTTTTESGADEPKPEPKPEVVTIVVRDGQPVGGVAELEFAKGERIRFVVRSDIAEEVHLHGYDVFQDVKAGGKVEFDVPATIDGLFEAELEHSHVPIAEISVTPG